jgi:hypothetical protein
LCLGAGALSPALCRCGRCKNRESEQRDESGNAPEGSAVGFSFHAVATMEMRQEILMAADAIGKVTGLSLIIYSFLISSQKTPPQ